MLYIVTGGTQLMSVEPVRSCAFFTLNVCHLKDTAYTTFICQTQWSHRPCTWKLRLPRVSTAAVLHYFSGVDYAQTRHGCCRSCTDKTVGEDKTVGVVDHAQTRYGCCRSCTDKIWVLVQTVLLGDSAHIMSPDMGQGLNAGLEDVAVFADTLKQHSGNVSSALPAFSRARLPDIHALTLINQIVSSDELQIVSQVRHVPELCCTLCCVNVVL